MLTNPEQVYLKQNTVLLSHSLLCNCAKYIVYVLGIRKTFSFIFESFSTKPGTTKHFIYFPPSDSIVGNFPSFCGILVFLILKTLQLFWLNNQKGFVSLYIFIEKGVWLKKYLGNEQILIIFLIDFLMFYKTFIGNESYVNNGNYKNKNNKLKTKLTIDRKSQLKCS